MECRANRGAEIRGRLVQGGTRQRRKDGTPFDPLHGLGRWAVEDMGRWAWPQDTATSGGMGPRAQGLSLQLHLLEPLGLLLGSLRKLGWSLRADGRIGDQRVGKEALCSG